MADSLCGPSNALQNFQKHSSVDRTLQQERIAARKSVSQGFRSASGVNAESLESEFASFQAGQLPIDNAFQDARFPYPQPSIQQAGNSSWASDFQRLIISNPQIQQNSLNSQSAEAYDNGGWHLDSAQLKMGDGSKISGYTGMNSYPHMGGVVVGSPIMSRFLEQQSESQMIQPQLSIEEAFESEAFAQAFDEAARSERVVRQEISRQGTELGQNTIIEKRIDDVDPSFVHDQVHKNQARIGADLIEDEEVNQKDDQDALSETASRLLHSVRNEQSLKFQNSQFMELMRQFRDREATVAGDQVVAIRDDEELGGTHYTPMQVGCP